MGLKKNWKQIIDHVQAKLSLWKAKKLSIGGRLTLVKLVLDSLPLYYFSILKLRFALSTTKKKLEEDFYGDGVKKKQKINWVAWTKVLDLKEKGGHGIGSL